MYVKHARKTVSLCTHMSLRVYVVMIKHTCNSRYLYNSRSITWKFLLYIMSQTLSFVTSVLFKNSEAEENDKKLSVFL